MATINWPDTLPQNLSASNFNHTLGDNTIRDQFDTGPAGVRGRSTAAVEPLTAHLPPIATDQWTSLVTFYKTTLSKGTLAFGLPEPGTSNQILVRFVKPPARAYLGADLWDVALELEILP